jgi:hypothetical protein
MASKTKKSIPVDAADTPLYSRVREILESARSNVVRTVNTTQVIANWLIGREIVEEEQAGQTRAGYGTALLLDLAARLKANFGRGYGVDNLEMFRRFYVEYPDLMPGLNSDAVRRKSDALVNSETLRRNFGTTQDGAATLHAVSGESA